MTRPTAEMANSKGPLLHPTRISQRSLSKGRAPLPKHRTIRYSEGPRNLVSAIVALVWMITTIKFGPNWLTPLQVAFFALLLNSNRSRCPICGGKALPR